MKKTHRYNNYNEYIEHQKKKTCNPVKRKKWLGIEWDKKINIFTKAFKKLNKYITADKKAICLGARTGQEVITMKNLGLDAIGIDIVPHEPFVKKGDIHDIKYDDNTFDIVFSNIFDHSLYPEKFISEIERILKPGGYSILHLQINVEGDDYTEVEIPDPKYVIKLFKKCKLVHSKILKPKVVAMDHELVLQKN